MHKYSFVVSIYGWSAVNKITGKKVYGDFTDLPDDISKALIKVVKPSTSTLCIACSVNLPETNEFHQWFMRQPSML